MAKKYQKCPKNKLGYIGVHYDKRRNTFYSAISVDGVPIVCGYDDDIIKVVKLRDLYIIKHRLCTTKFKLQIIKPIKPDEKKKKIQT